MSNQTIVLYSTGCPVCKMLKMRLDAAGIKYLTITDIDAMKKLGIKSAPVLGVDGELMTAAEAMKWLSAESSTPPTGCAACQTEGDTAK